MKRQLAVIGAAGLLAAGMIYAQATGKAQANAAPDHAKATVNHRANGRRGHMRMMRALKLTPEQKVQAKAIFAQSREASKPVREQLRQNRVAMRTAVKANDKNQIARLGAERGNLMGKLTTARTEAMAKFYQQLTPEQRAKAEQMQARTEARMHQRRMGAGAHTPSHVG